MIISQQFFIPSIATRNVIWHLKNNGYEIRNEQFGAIAFDASKHMCFFRFLKDAKDNINDIVSTQPDDEGLYGICEIIRPYVRSGSYIIMAGGKQEELEGIIFKEDELYQATNITVSFEVGDKMEEEED